MESIDFPPLLLPFALLPAVLFSEECLQVPERQWDVACVSPPPPTSPSFYQRQHAVSLPHAFLMRGFRASPVKPLRCSPEPLDLMLW